MDPFLKDMVNLGGMGILSAVLYILLNKLISVFKDELERERTRCSEEHALMTEHLSQLTDQVRLMQEKLVVLEDRRRRGDI